MAVCLTGKIVLVAEDDALIGMDVEAMLWGVGCIVLGPYMSVADALAGIQTQRPDVALLDVKLNDGAVTPVADALTASDVPFALLTGTDDPALLNGLASAPRVMKPFAYAQVEEMLRDLVKIGLGRPAIEGAAARAGPTRAARPS